MDTETLKRLFHTLDGKTFTHHWLTGDSDQVLIAMIDNTYNIGIQLDEFKPFEYTFTSVEVKATTELDGKPRIVLSTHEYSDLFLLVGLDFLHEEKRHSLITNPLEWCEMAASLLGNKKGSKRPESVVAELMILEKALKRDPEAKWKGPIHGKTDILTQYEELEVKSTLSKDKVIIDVSSSHQTDETTRSSPLYMTFVRLTKVKVNGFSIDSLVESLSGEYGRRNEWEALLTTVGYPIGRPERNYRYELAEDIRYYLVDEKFPSISNCLDSKSECMNYIKKIKYSLDLTNYQAFATDVLD